MKLFLQLTAIYEALTGLALIFFPSRIVFLLFGTALDSASGQISAMIEGSAILSLAFIC